MRTYVNPDKSTWPDLCSRPTQPLFEIEPTVRRILTDVEKLGDRAVLDYTEKYDGVALSTTVYNVRPEVSIPNDLEAAIRLAYGNIWKFHETQDQSTAKVETVQGVECWRQSSPIEKVGLYIPGGTAPLFSSLLMLGIPARIAGCREIVVCTPPDSNGQIHAAIEFTANLLGISNVYMIGGAQAVGAMAYGTETIPKVQKIFGPGNQYVTMAKMLVQQNGTAIDMPAGPSEVLVIADEHSNADFVASDLLSQAEHGPDSQVVLATNSEQTVTRVQDAIARQLPALPRMSIAEKALANSFAVILPDLAQAMTFSNSYAPEHLILNTANADELASMVTNAGSVFVGALSCESLGDYASGTNHTLPTNGFAANYSGVSLDSFVKKITFQKVNDMGLRSIGPAVEVMAENEQLLGHKNAVTIRLKTLQS